jgi:hypothetical protein
LEGRPAMQLRDFVLSTTRGDNPLNANLEGDSKKEDQGKITDFSRYSR